MRIVLTTVAALVACYQPSPFAPCTLTCAPSTPCPDDLVCGADGRCHASGETCAPGDSGIYRSVGPGNTGALATGAGNQLVVIDQMATFARALPDRVGVGDVVQYDSNGDGQLDALAFVHGRISATQFVVASATGGVPTPTGGDDTWSMFRAYTSLREAARGERNQAIALDFDGWVTPPNLVTLGTRWHLACYGDAVDRPLARFIDWATSETEYLRIFTPTSPAQVGTSQRHAGTWDPSKYHLETPGVGSNDLAIGIHNMSARVEGLQVFVNTDGASTDLPVAINFVNLDATNHVHVSSSIVRSNNVSNPTTMARGIKVDAAAGGAKLYVSNNIIYDFGGSAPARGLELTGLGITAYVVNNTIIDVSTAIGTISGDHIVLLRNTFALACDGSCVAGPGTYQGSNNVGAGFDLRGVGVAPSSTVLTDYLRGPGDLHIAPGAPRANELVDKGANLAGDVDLAFDDDIDGERRGAVWDIGADEL